MIGDRFIAKYLDSLADLLTHRQRIYWMWRFKYSKGLKRFANIHDGQDCFIIGNGPSLNHINLDKLSNHYTFGLNKIYLLFDKFKFRPTYHVAVNPLVIEQSVQEIKLLPCPTFLCCRANTKYLSGLAKADYVGEMDHVHQIMTTASLGFAKDLLREISIGATVTYVAMQIAYSMGFRNVYLVGVDHNFVVNGSPNERQYLSGDDINHFDPNYFAGNDWHLPDLEGSEIAYRLAKYFYEKDGRKIYDATVGGKLQIFPKISFEQALKKSKGKLGL